SLSCAIFWFACCKRSSSETTRCSAFRPLSSRLFTEASSDCTRASAAARPWRSLFTSSTMRSTRCSSALKSSAARGIWVSSTASVDIRETPQNDFVRSSGVLLLAEYIADGGRVNAEKLWTGGSEGDTGLACPQFSANGFHSRNNAARELL